MIVVDCCYPPVGEEEEAEDVKPLLEDGNPKYDCVSVCGFMQVIQHTCARKFYFHLYKPSFPISRTGNPALQK